jgi:hypothetical protein
LCTLLPFESVLYSLFVHVCASAYHLAPTFTDYHTMNDLNVFPFCDNLGPYLKERCVIITCWQNIVVKFRSHAVILLLPTVLTCLVVVE